MAFPIEVKVLMEGVLQNPVRITKVWEGNVAAQQIQVIGKTGMGDVGQKFWIKKCWKFNKNHTYMTSVEGFFGCK